MNGSSWHPSILYFVLFLTLLCISLIKWDSILPLKLPKLELYSQRLEDHVPDHYKGIMQKTLDKIICQCVPRLVCEIYSSKSKQRSETEEKLLHIAESQSIFDSQNGYTFAAFIGQQIMENEGSGCNDFFSDCPFSSHDMREIAKRTII
ncbi:unnamed protein product [Lepeophtheirus salmonis]|nr:unnamed protein product [Lepeophtheirus salmonis]CAF2876364.1 unnamed protein product [Lepeophtheirus salmonis]